MILASGARGPGLNSQNSPTTSVHQTVTDSDGRKDHQPTCCIDSSSAQWRNGSASDSRSEGWEFESLLGQVCGWCESVVVVVVVVTSRGRPSNSSLLQVIVWSIVPSKKWYRSLAGGRWRSVGRSVVDGRWRSLGGGRSVVAPFPPPFPQPPHPIPHHTHTRTQILRQSLLASLHAVHPNQRASNPPPPSPPPIKGKRGLKRTPIARRATHIGANPHHSHATTAFSDLRTRDGTRTHNLLLRREAPYPLGHTSSGMEYACQVYLSKVFDSCGI